MSAKRTSCEVPNSITVVSPYDPGPRRVTRTPIRTGAASGKNFASRPTMLDWAERAGATPCCDNWNPLPVNSERSRFPRFSSSEEHSGGVSTCSSWIQSAPRTPKVEGHGLACIGLTRIGLKGRLLCKPPVTGQAGFTLRRRSHFRQKSHLLERLRRVAFGGSRADVIPLQFPVKCRPADPQHLSG